MNTQPRPPTTAADEETRPLTQVLADNEHIKDLVEQSAAELAAVNDGIEKELESSPPLPGVEEVLGKSQAVEDKVQEAHAKLAAVNLELESAVREREMLDHRLAAAIEQEEAARHAAFHDVLTGLPNRALFNDRLVHAFAQAARHHWLLAVLFVDLDGFKQVNDLHGHDAGDDVLRMIARRLKECARDEDTVCRHGGDEFLYLLAGIQEETDVGAIAEKVLATVREPCLLQIRGVPFTSVLEASIGIAIYPRDGTTADALIKAADAAMYRAKKQRGSFAYAQ